tara:strand:+ start:171 stop:806 length:636 start_codon:yes stop_codon:yes gene_type:complete
MNKINRRINHRRRFIGQPKVISKRDIIPGMIITFSYKGYHNDPKPLILFLGLERQKSTTSDDLIHGINLNYLHESAVQKLFEELSKHTPVKFGKGLEKWGSNFGFVEIEKEMESPGNNAKVLYETVIRPKLMRSSYTKNCYRTYFFNKMQSISLVNYKLDIVEKTIREQTGLSKHALKPSELFKQIDEDQIDVNVDNRPNLSQTEIRKGDV